MQHTLFIADLHLDEKHETTVATFKKFLQQQASQAEALYILGDFFELWVGDDDPSAFVQDIKNTLKEATKRAPIFILTGNRDFLLGKRFCQETGCSLLSENTVINLYGKSVLLLHGDALCTLDKKHMLFRRITQSWLIRHLFLSLPLLIRRKIGFKLRATSKQHQSIISHEKMQVVENTVIKFLNKYQVSHMIHGHIHQPNVFNFLCRERYSERIVLGSWDKNGCAFKWCDNDKGEMLFFD